MIYAILFAAILLLLAVIAGLLVKTNLAEERNRHVLDQIEELSRRATEAETIALANAAEWLKREEARMRADSVKRSEFVLTGKVAEQLTPFLDAFTYNPRDARFLGSPIDLIVFEGMSEGSIERIVLIEVKTGRSNLSEREQQVQDAVRLGEVDYEILRIEK